MTDKFAIVVLALLSTAVVAHSIGFGDLANVYKMLQSGVNATCVEIPDFVKNAIIPIKCVKCENNLWSFKGELSLTNLRACFNAANVVGINVVGLVTSITVSLLYCLF